MAIIWGCLYGLSVLGALVVLVAAAVSDFRSMTIANRWPVLLAVLFPVAYGAAWQMGIARDVFEPFAAHAMAGGVIFTVTFLVFAAGIWGAGDSKLATGAAIWAGLTGLVPFLTVMALVGLVLALLSLLLRKRTFLAGCGGDESWLARLSQGQAVLPYGIAIAIGAIWAMVDGGYFRPILQLLDSVF